MIMKGIPMTKRHVNQGKKNLAPPCLKVKYGNLQKLPRPMADPMAAMMKVILPIHLGLSSGLSFSSLL